MYTLTTKGYFLTEKSASATAENELFISAYLPESITKVVQNKVFTNEPESKFFVSVDYYGKKNTKVKYFSSLLRL